MVAISLAAPVAGLMLVTSHISDPALSPAVFNKWYSDIHVRDMVNNNFSSVALRYANYTLNSHVTSPTFTLASQYLALYNVPDINFISNPGTMSKLPLNSDMLPDKVRPVTTWSAWNFTYWLRVQSYEGNSTATERAKYVVMVRIEPAKGGDDELDQWYKNEHLPMLSALPGYRRSTRWKSSDGSKPKHLALHEVDDVDTFMAASDPAFKTEQAKKVLGTATTFDTSTWQLFLQKGKTDEKLGK